MAKKRLSIRNLVPGEKYAVQVRAVDEEGYSTWSQKYHFTAVDDTLGGTRKPTAPVVTSFSVDASGQFVAGWNGVSTNTDNSLAVITRYDVELNNGNGVQKIVAHSPQTGLAQSRSFNFALLRSLFGGDVPPSLTVRVRAVNSAGTMSAWSNSMVAALPAPNPPENVTALAVVDGIKISWSQPSNPSNLFGYRVYVGFSSGFTPNAASLAYQGMATEFSYTSLTYGVTHYFKVVSYSEAGIESTPVQVSAQPLSAYGPDNIAPLSPVLGNPTLDRTDLKSPKANLTWTINEAASENQDLAGFVIRWKIAGEPQWRSASFDKTARSGIIGLPNPFANYNFEISAYDFTANYSSYAGTLKTLVGMVAAPAQVTGLDSIARYDGLRITWTESTSDSVKYGGKYDVQFKTTNSFTNDTPDYTTGTNSIDIAGLPSQATRYMRVRAVDASGQTGPWSAVHTKTLPLLPVPAASDGLAPSTAPTGVAAKPGLNYINIAWNPVANNDPVTYEVYMGTSSGVTAIAGNLVGRSTGTSLVVNSTAAGTALTQGTTYYFKVRAVDVDNSGPLSAEVNSTLMKVLGPDLGIDVPGENLYINSSFEEPTPGNAGLANYWLVYYSPGTAGVTATPTLTAGRTGGVAQRVTWSGATSSNKGVYSTGASVLRPNTEYILSFYARANAGTGFRAAYNVAPVSQAWITNPAPSATVWQRYVYRMTTGATVDPSNVFIAIVGNDTAAGWVEFDDMQIEAGSIPSAYKTGTVSISKLTTGRFTAADMIIAGGGRVVSQAYLNNPNTGFLITDTGITIKDGQVDAKTLVANSTFTNNLNVGSKFTIAASGTIESTGYSAGPNPTGFRLSASGLDIRSGFVAASTLGAGIITSPDIRVGAGGKITIDSTGVIQSNTYTEGVTGWQISRLGIKMWDAESKISVSALTSGVVDTTVITIGSGGEVRSASWPTNAGPRWRLSETGLTMHGGVIEGSSVVTNQLQSATTVSTTVDGVTTTEPTFSINPQGYAQLVGARILGNAVIGIGPDNALQSGNFMQGSAGWKIAGNGDAEFANITSRAPTGAMTSIRNITNPYETSTNQDWNVISMQPSNPTWAPGQLWVNHLSGTGVNHGYLKISSPKGPNAGKDPAFIILQHNMAPGFNQTKVIVESDVFESTAANYKVGVIDDIRLELTPANTYLRSPFFNFGNTQQGQPIVMRIIDVPGANISENWSFRGKTANRIDLAIGHRASTVANRIASRDEVGSAWNMELFATSVSFEIPNASGTIQAFRATSMNNRVMFVDYPADVGLVFAGNGELRVTNATGSGYRDIRARSFQVESDISSKTNIEEVSVTSMREKLSELKAYDYTTIPHTDCTQEDIDEAINSGKRNRGMLAHEIHEVMPEATVESPEGEGGLGVDIYALLTNTIAAFNELQVEFNELKARVDSENN